MFRALSFSTKINIGWEGGRMYERISTWWGVGLGGVGADIMRREGGWMGTLDSAGNCVQQEVYVPHTLLLLYDCLLQTSQ